MGHRRLLEFYIPPRRHPFGVVKTGPSPCCLPGLPLLEACRTACACRFCPVQSKAYAQAQTLDRDRPLWSLSAPPIANSPRPKSLPAFWHELLHNVKGKEALNPVLLIDAGTSFFVAPHATATSCRTCLESCYRIRKEVSVH